MWTSTTDGLTGYQPTGWQGAAQHTYTRACDGLHPPGPCPPTQEPARIQAGS